MYSSVMYCLNCITEREHLIVTKAGQGDVKLIVCIHLFSRIIKREVDMEASFLFVKKPTYENNTSQMKMKLYQMQN